MTTRLYLLDDVYMRRTGATDTDSNVIFRHVLLRNGTSFLRERGREHHVDMIIVGIRI